MSRWMTSTAAQASDTDRAAIVQQPNDRMKCGRSSVQLELCTYPPSSRAHWNSTSPRQAFGPARHPCANFPKQAQHCTSMSGISQFEIGAGYWDDWTGYRVGVLTKPGPSGRVLLDMNAVGPLAGRPWACADKGSRCRARRRHTVLEPHNLAEHVGRCTTCALITRIPFVRYAGSARPQAGACR